ncbi:MAG TPA: hypothetical protein VFH58_09935 [Acidimicrobiales bacterium]|nr:hypothetical protein [Acidimicrobiales bacterium]
MPADTRLRRMDRQPARRPRRRRAARARAAVAVSVLVVAGAVVGGVALVRAFTQKPAPPVGCQVPDLSGPGTFRLSTDQGQNATIIAAVGIKLGLPDHAVTIGLATALRESHLVDLTYGDLDSVGLFQQRPSQGWGTNAQILDPVYASTVFYQHLEKVPGWQTMGVTDAAQAVQRSATPLAYAPYESEARALASALTGEKPATFACRLDGFSGVVPTASGLSAAAAREMGSAQLGVPLSSQKAGWELASWAVGHAWRYHLQAVTFGSWRWTAASGRWVDSPGAGAATPAVQVRYAS